MTARVKIVLKSGKDQSVRRYHPWIFSGAIKKIIGDPDEGDEVELFDNKDNFLAVGHYQPGSIAVRIMDFNDRRIDRSFYLDRISAAIDYRKGMGYFDNPDTTLFRLVHAEGDGLPGLIIDNYDGVAVIQIHSAGIFRSREVVADVLKEILGDYLIAVFDKSESTVPYKADLKAENGFILGDSDLRVVKEYGYNFQVDWVNGQKTGFYIDQRENRKLVESFTSGKDVLNMFGYTGGFSVYAMSNANTVHTVDVSNRAVEMANLNIGINFPEDKRHSAYAADAFEYLDNCENRYDLIILDPPAFAKHNNVLHNALQGYKRLNLKAIQTIKKGGIIFTFSCSQVVSRENFRKSVFVAAANTGRKVRVIHQLGQPADHPVNIYHPESEYLKGLVLYIE